VRTFAEPRIVSNEFVRSIRELYRTPSPAIHELPGFPSREHPSIINLCHLPSVRLANYDVVAPIGSGGIGAKQSSVVLEVTEARPSPECHAPDESA
jgi:hypothetical protein